MRKCLVAVALILFSATPLLAGPVPALTSPPASFTCSFTTITTTNDAIHCTWDELPAATKYSVEAIANYDLGNGLGSQSADFDFGTKLTEVTIPLSALPGDVDSDGIADTIVSLVLRVKGLMPPGKTDYNQANSFSPTVTCTVSDGICS